MVDPDELEKKLWQLRDISQGKREHVHSHKVQWKGNTLLRPCPLEERFGCFLDQEIMFHLGVNSRTITQLDMGNIYNHILGIIMSSTYEIISPHEGATRIVAYLTKQAKEHEELEGLLK